ncbi:hypothetical protein CA12_26150 [Alienimonas californiensis]|uniref:Uncharacterized protein n=1 Tax=Alienimonas californiensis TaxID=2527989 RepID=A0A517PAV8_9PLAN|nr:hypothetical protein CA12_26150 [Alienimonas californiensis]
MTCGEMRAGDRFGQSVRISFNGETACERAGCAGRAEPVTIRRPAANL